MMCTVRALPTYDEAAALPGVPRRPVPAAYGDSNGHMNVRHYLGTFDDAEWELFGPHGLDTEASHGGGLFALEQYLTYRREVLVGAEVSVHLRVVGRDERMLHLVSYLLDHDEGRVAASMEALEAYVDHGTRRLAPFPAPAAAELDRLAAEHRALPWRPDLSGAMALRGAR